MNIQIKDTPTPLFLFSIIIIIALIISIAFIKRSKDDKLLDKNGRYIIGTTIGIIHRSSGYWVEYEFYYKNRKGYGRKRDEYIVKKNDGRYLVLFNPNDLLNNKVFWEKQVPNGIECPIEGWDSIPDFVIKYNKKEKRK